MLRSVPATSISTRQRDALTIRALLAIVLGSARVLLTERLRWRGMTGYIALVALRPIFEVGIAALVYRARPELLGYVVVALAANAFVFNVNFFVGEILDNERIRGTLAGLFLTPAPRSALLGGFALVGLFDVALAGGAVLLFGHFGLGVTYAPNWFSLAITLPLFVAALWGLGFAFSALGLWVKKANPLSNIVAPFMTLLGGAYYPVSQLPEPLHTIARALPNGYGLQAIANATLYGASPATLLPQLVPLAAFAIALPLLGGLAFRWVERAVRVRGELDLY
jgi:ABC-type multidrug transport system permease subunit